MSVVIDSSVVVAALVDSGPHGDWAEEVLAGGLLQAPELVLAEATNIFRRLERAKLITTPEANAAQDDLMQLDIDLFPFEPFAGRIRGIASRRHELRRLARRHCRGAQAPARNSGRTSIEIKRSHLEVPDARILI